MPAGMPPAPNAGSPGGPSRPGPVRASLLRLQADLFAGRTPAATASKLSHLADGPALVSAVGAEAAVLAAEANALVGRLGRGQATPRPARGASGRVPPRATPADPRTRGGPRRRGTSGPRAARAAARRTPARGRTGPAHLDRLPHGRRTAHASTSSHPPGPRDRHRIAQPGVRRHRAVALCVPASSAAGLLPRPRTGSADGRRPPPARRGVRHQRPPPAIRPHVRCPGRRASRGAARLGAVEHHAATGRGATGHRCRPAPDPQGEPRRAGSASSSTGTCCGRRPSRLRRGHPDPPAERGPGRRGGRTPAGRHGDPTTYHGHPPQGSRRTVDAAHGRHARGRPGTGPPTRAPAGHHPVELIGVVAVAPRPRHPRTHRDRCPLGHLLGAPLGAVDQGNGRSRRGPGRAGSGARNDRDPRRRADLGISGSGWRRRGIDRGAAAGCPVPQHDRPRRGTRHPPRGEPSLLLGAS